jgi:hypothetical protein
MAELVSCLSIIPHMRSFDVPPKLSPAHAGLFLRCRPLAMLRRRQEEVAGRLLHQASFSLVAHVERIAIRTAPAIISMANATATSQAAPSPSFGSLWETCNRPGNFARGVREPDMIRRVEFKKPGN